MHISLACRSSRLVYPEAAVLARGTEKAAEIEPIGTQNAEDGLQSR